MNKYDPNEVFINSFGHRIKESGTKVDLDPLLTRCALLDNCFCTKNGDCGKNQICTTISGYSYRVCKTKNEIPVDFFPKIEFPSASGIFDFFSTESKKLGFYKDCNFEKLLPNKYFYSQSFAK